MKNYFNHIGFGVLLLKIIFLSNTIHGQHEPCLDSQFMCNTTKICIPENWRCDEDVDCSEDGSDKSDEKNCPVHECTDREFKCANGHCINKDWKCDLEDDCHDGSDESEKTCANIQCTEDTFACGNGTCIPLSWRCDGQDDCPNGKDEICSKEQYTCAEDEFRCKNGECISNKWVCDSDRDCPPGDNSDELNCATSSTANAVSTCGADQFQCNNSRCIDMLWKCDGDVDCDDHSDENPELCKNSSSVVCEASEWQCESGEQKCIHNIWLCDGDPDCDDGSDESVKNCKNVTCRNDQFQCADKSCVHDILRCDGFYDCVDGSDELNCSSQSVGCTESEFDCSSDGTECIPLNLVCDKSYDCSNSKDEDVDICREKNPCEQNNGGCAQECVYLYHDKYRCDCRTGFKKVGNFSCDDINECEEKDPPRCSQKCVNIKGGYKCECELGYTLERESYCKIDGERPWLLLANRHDLRLMHSETGSMKAVAEDLQSSISTDYDYKDGFTFWSDVSLECILRIDRHGGIEHVVDKNIMTPDGIAVDWVYNHIYWTDTGFDTIDVATYDGTMRTTLVHSDLDEPRAIVVDPREGWMYWSDWGKTPKIERCGMDGSHREVIVSKNISWPNGLTIDYVSKKLYWIDAKQNEIKSVNYDGSEARTVVHDATKVVHPFAITVFEDTLYWTDWSTDSVRAINKMNGLDYKQVEIGLHSPMDLHAHHELAQRDYTNYCPTSYSDKCSHLCLPAPYIRVTVIVKKYTCACPTGMVLLSDGRNCKVNAKIQTSPKPSTKKTTSPNDSHRINNGTVIPASSTTSTPTPAAASTQTPKHIIEVSTESQATYTVIAGNKSTTEKTIKLKEEQNVGVVAGIAIAIVIGVAIIIAIVGYIVFRRYKKQNLKSMNFDNPVYKKTVTDENFIIHRDQSNRESALEPLTSEIV